MRGTTFAARAAVIAAMLVTASSNGAAARGNPERSEPRSVPAAPDEAVWHLRAVLNVAALTCRGQGRISVAPAYGRILSRHKALLANAYAAEQRRYGGGFDRHQTQLYNRFANQDAPERFCRNAARVADRAAAMESPLLAVEARDLLREIDQG